MYPLHIYSGENTLMLRNRQCTANAIKGTARCVGVKQSGQEACYFTSKQCIHSCPQKNISNLETGMYQTNHFAEIEIQTHKQKRDFQG